MQLTMTDEQLARLARLNVEPLGQDENAAHRVGMFAGALQLALAIEADYKKALMVETAMLTDTGEHKDDKLRRYAKIMAKKSAVDGFIDALEMLAGTPVRIEIDADTVIESAGSDGAKIEVVRRPRAKEPDCCKILLAQCLGGEALAEAVRADEQAKSRL